MSSPGEPAYTLDGRPISDLEDWLIESASEDSSLLFQVPAAAKLLSGTEDEQAARSMAGDGIMRLVSAGLVEVASIRNGAITKLSRDEVSAEIDSGNAWRQPSLGGYPPDSVLEYWATPLGIATVREISLTRRRASVVYADRWQP